MHPHYLLNANKRLNVLLNVAVIDHLVTGNFQHNQYHFVPVLKDLEFKKTAQPSTNSLHDRLHVYIIQICIIHTLKWAWQQALSICHELKLKPFDLNFSEINVISQS